MSSYNLTAVILAAGLGTRMKSKLPKVLHKITGVPMINHVLQALEQAQIQRKILVLGHGAKEVEEQVGVSVEVVYQREQLGTGHAVLQTRPLLEKCTGPVLVVCGDTPLLRGETLAELIEKHEKGKQAVTVLTAQVENPYGYGRIVRQGGKIVAIREEKDATMEEKKITEINTGTYCFSGPFLVEALDKLTSANAQGEYYLTDLIELAVKAGLNVESFILEDSRESLGINNRLQLAQAAKIMQQRILEKLMLDGVTIIDPDNTYVEAKVSIGQDTILYPGTYLQGDTIIGSDCLIGPNTRIVSSKIGNNNTIQNTVILESQINDNCQIGPFAYLRPGTVIEEGVKIGDFVEIKKSTIGKGSKVPHLTYVGDAFVGKKVNIGCGTITCNYDGEKKHVTIIKDGAFIGSNSNLVAPVTIEENAFIAAGSTITEDVPENSLGIARGKQKNIINWVKKKKD